VEWRWSLRTPEVVAHDMLRSRIWCQIDNLLRDINGLWSAVIEFAMVLLTLIPLEVLLPELPSPTPSAAYPSRGGPGRGAYILGGFIGLGILLLAMALLRLPKGRQGRRPDY
jgi:hypothetical protein